ncbi:MAG: histidine phosphatase family protein [Actinobacteria bacterium]|nr:histidine phosphatase family protein [Actinomycetota bacterium]
MTIRLWLVRHGSTEWSEAGRYTGSTDLQLSERGKAEAGALTWLADRSWTGVWTSDLKRAGDTARLAGMEATPDRRLREIDFGRLEGMTWAELDRPTRDALAAFDRFDAPGGESTGGLLTRLEGFIDDLPPGDHLAFTHGGVIRTLVRTTGADRHLGPGEVAVLEIDGASRRDVSVDFLEKPVDSGRDRSSS